MKAFVGINLQGTGVERKLDAARKHFASLGIASFETPSSPMHITLIPPLEMNLVETSRVQLALRQTCYEIASRGINLVASEYHLLRHSGVCYLTVKVNDPSGKLNQARDKIVETLTLMGYNYPLAEKSWTSHATVGFMSDQHSSLLGEHLNAFSTTNFSINHRNLFVPYKDNNGWCW